MRFHGLFAGRSRARPQLRSKWVEHDLAREADAIAAQASSSEARPETERFGAWMPDDVLDVVPAPSPGESYLPWAELLWRVRGIDTLRCSRCGGTMQPIELVVDPDAIEQALRHPATSPPHSKGPAG